MKKSELFLIILDKVAEVCEVRKEDILSGTKVQAVVDARILAIQYMRRMGLSSDDIAVVMLRMNSQEPGCAPTIKEIKAKAKSIDKTFNLYSSRCLDSKAFQMMSIEIRDFCRETFVVDQ